MTGDDLLGEAIGELYSADPEEFVVRRGELAAAARAAGQPAVARQIAGLRKPTRSAWMINQLVRADPGAATRLAALGEKLRAVERSGDGTRMRELSRARRQLITALVGRALAGSGQHPPPAALREEITATLSAALADPEVAGQIQQATLVRPARRTGFGTAQAPALALVPPPPDSRPGVREGKPARAGPVPGRPSAGPAADATRAGAARASRRAGGQAEQIRAEAGQARAEAERHRRQRRAEAEQALAAAERAAQAARQVQQEHEATVRRLEEQLTETRRQLREARAQARQAEIARRKARQVLDRVPER